MTANSIKSSLESVVNTFLSDNNVSGDDDLTTSQNVDLTDLLASKLETVNPNNNYPATPK